VEVFVIKGLIKNSGYLMTMLLVGSKGEAHQLAHISYSRIEEMSSLGRFLPSQIDSSRLPNAEIIVVCARRPLIDKFLKSDFLVLPHVNFVLDLSSSYSGTFRRLSRRRRRDIRKLRTYKYSYTVCRNGKKDFDFFYWKMYYPYTIKRFGEGALLKTYLRSRASYRGNGGIVFVKKEGKPIAGILFQISGRTLYALSLGVHDGNEDPVRDVVGQAALFYLIEWARTKGIAKLDYGATVPFFRDGNFQYKKEWGMSVERKGDQPFCILKINRISKGSLSFLLQNPFILCDNGLLKGVIFLDRRLTKRELEQISSEYFLPKLDSLIVIACSDHGIESASELETHVIHSSPQNIAAKPLLNTCLLLQTQGFTVDMFECVPKKFSFASI
jgi:hypothetical protein